MKTVQDIANLEPMPAPRTLMPFVAITLATSSCREPTKLGDAPSTWSAELQGARWNEDGIPRFDDQYRPKVVLSGTVPSHIEVQFEGNLLPSELVARGAHHLLRVTATPLLGNGAMCAVEPHRRQCWPVRLAAVPDERPATSSLKAMSLEAMPKALTTLQGEDRVWGQQIYARALRRAGQPAAARDAWEASAAAGQSLGLNAAAARALRSGAFMAYLDGDLRGGELLLDRAAALLRNDATTRDHLLDSYYRAVIGYALNRFRTATELSEAVAERAWAMGEDDLFGYGIEMLALVLVDQGRTGEAQAAIDDGRLAALVVRRPADQQAAYLSNRAWIGLLALAGGQSVDPSRIRQDLAGALAHAASPREARGIHINRAWLELLTDDIASAQRAIDSVTIDANDPDAELMRGEIALRQSRLDDAAAAFDRAATTLERTAAGLPTDNTWRAAYGLGRIAAARGDRSTALTHYRAALAALDAVGARAGVWHARARFYADRRPLVDDTVRLLLAAGEIAEAFAVVDAANARALRALEARTRLDRLPAAVRTAWEQERARFAAARQAWDAAREEGELLGPEQKARWQAEQDARQKAMVAAFEAAEALLTREAPARVAASDAAAITAALPPKSALLAFGRVGDVVHGFWLAPGHVVEHRALERDPSPAALVAAFADALPGVTHLYVVPGDVPAARELATVERDGAPLGTRLSMSDLAYAGLVLRPRPAGTRPPLVVADPTVDLPHAYEEGRRVAARLPGARVLSRAEATREAVREAMAGARAMHYAGHGVARAESPWQAHLALAGETTLTVADILTADVPAGTVVLSGCRTGVRGALSEREALGLADAFVAAGSRAVLATRRNIPDDAAARFIARFHAEGGLERPGAALRATTAAFHRDGDPIWSAFRLTGHP